MILDQRTADSSEQLQTLNEDIVTELYPVIAFYCIVMGLIVFGNPLVMYFFSVRQSGRPSHLLIAALALYDFIVGIVAMPLDLFDTVNYVLKYNNYICKLNRFFTYFAGTSSALIICAIASERRQTICYGIRPSSRVVRIRIAIITVGAFLSAIPSLFLYTQLEYSMTGSYNVTAFTCTSHVAPEHKMYLYIYFLVLLSLFIIASFSMSVMYIFVFKHIQRHRNNNRYTKIMITISVCFVLSYLPFISLSIWRTIYNRYVLQFSTRSQFVAYEFFVRSYFWSGAVNPILYGIMNNGFKEFLLSLPNRACRCLFNNPRDLFLNDYRPTADSENSTLLT